MNTSTSWVRALMVAVSVVGCATSAVERKDATTSSLVELRDSMVATRGQIDQTLASLNGLISAPPDRLRDTYARYAKDADTIAQQAATVDKESRQMRQRSDQWLTAWQKSQGEVGNPELKALSERRRAQALLRFQSMEASLAVAREEFAPFVANLQDVKKVVGNDLTPNSVAAVSATAVVQNANQHGTEAGRALDAAIADLQELTQTLEPAK